MIVINLKAGNGTINMLFSKDEIDFIAHAQPLFVSLKYLDQESTPQEYDLSAKFILNDFSDTSLSFLPELPYLRILPGRIFLDPFRALRSVTIFCQPITETPISYLKRELEEALSSTGIVAIQSVISYVPYLNQEQKNVTLASVDNFANLRADIASTLENVSKLRVVSHYFEKEIEGKNGAENIKIICKDIETALDDCFIASFIINNVFAGYGLSAPQETVPAVQISVRIFVENEMEMHNIEVKLYNISINNLLRHKLNYTIKKLEYCCSKNVFCIDVVISNLLF